MQNKTIVVIGATGSQGKGVVNSLVGSKSFYVKAATRKPTQYLGQANETVYVDLFDYQSVLQAFDGAYGVFVVTTSQEDSETLQCKNALEAAKEAGVQHFIWSTLPNVASISNGEFDVHHFTAKAKMDDLVKNAGFKYSTFVQAPFYYQNLVGVLAPRLRQDGTTGWELPINPTKRVIHMADINDLGKIVTGAFLQPDKAGNGNYLSLAAGIFSFNDIIHAFKKNGQNYTFSQIPADSFVNSFEGAKGFTDMLKYFEKYSYMGPNSDQQIALAKEIAGGSYITFNEWLTQANIENRNS